MPTASVSTLPADPNAVADPNTVVLASNTHRHTDYDRTVTAMANNAQNTQSIGDSFVITLEHTTNQQPRIVCRVSHECLSLTPSGKVSHFWQLVQRTTLSRIAPSAGITAGLMIKRISTSGSNRTQRVWADDDDHTASITLANDLVAAVPPNMLESSVVADLAEIINNTLGTPDAILDRFPLLDPSHRDCVQLLAQPVQRCHQNPRTATSVVLDRLPAYATNPWIDAHDAATVARRLFGAKNYRTPLTALVGRIHPQDLALFSSFRGLVPIEAIIDAMRAHADAAQLATNPYAAITGSQSAREHTARRALLRATPKTVLLRMLKAPVVAREFAINDAAAFVAERNLDPAALTALIAARGQRNIRTPSQWEQLVLAITQRRRPSAKVRRSEAAKNAQNTRFNEHRRFCDINNERCHVDLEQISWTTWSTCSSEQKQTWTDQLREQRQARLTANQRAAQQQRQAHHLARVAAQTQRAAWATQLTATLDGAIVGGHHATVASSPAQLAMWGQHMANCIGSYAHELELDVFVSLAPRPNSDAVLNLQLSQERGLVQILGKYNRMASAVLDPTALSAVVDDLRMAGVKIDRNRAYGL